MVSLHEIRLVAGNLLQKCVICSPLLGIEKLFDVSKQSLSLVLAVETLSLPSLDQLLRAAAEMLCVEHLVHQVFLLVTLDLAQLEFLEVGHQTTLVLLQRHLRDEMRDAQ